MELKVELENIEKLIQQRAQELLQDSSHIKSVSKKEILQQLKSSEDEILKRHKEATRLWKKSLDLYADFITKFPGSKQVNSPSAIPEKPKQLDEIRGYIKLFNSLVGDTFFLDHNFLREIFNATSEGIYKMNQSVYAQTCAVSGNVVSNWNG